MQEARQVWCQGLFLRVLDRSERAYNLDMGVDSHGNSATSWHTVDRLKVAHLDPMEAGPDGSHALPARGGRGRPKGAKNKKK